MTAGDVGRMVTVMGPTVTVMGRIVTAMDRIVMSRMVAMRRCGWMAVRILPSASALSAGFWTLRRWCTDARLVSVGLPTLALTCISTDTVLTYP